MAGLYMRSPSGETRKVSDESVAEAKNQGWSVLNSKEAEEFINKEVYGAPLPTALATASRVAAGVIPFGASDWALKKLGGDEYVEFQKKAEAASPAITTAGYIAGSLVPGAAVAKVAGKAIQGAGWLATAARGGLVNTAFGASQLADDAIMQRRDPISVEHAATQLTNDFLIGAAADVALKGAGTVAKKAWGKLFAKSKQADIGMPTETPETGLEDTLPSPATAQKAQPGQPLSKDELAGMSDADVRKHFNMKQRAAVTETVAGKAGVKPGGRVTQEIKGDQAAAAAGAGQAKKVFEEVKLEAPQGLDKEGWLKKMGDKLLMRRVIKTRSDAGYHMAGKREDQLIDFVRRRGIFKDASAWENWDTAGQRIDDVGMQIKSEMEAALQSAEEVAPAAKFAQDIEERVTKAINTKYLGQADALAIAKQELDLLRKNLSDPAVSWETIRVARTNMWKRSHGQAGAVGNKLSSEVVATIQNELRDSYIEAIAANAGNDLGKLVKRSNNDLELHDVLSTLFDRKTVPQGAGSGMPGWWDWAAGAAGAAAGGAPGAAVSAAARRVAAGAYRQRPLIERQLLYKLGDSKIPDLAYALRNRLKAAASSQYLGHLKPVVNRMISLSDDEILNEHASMSVGVDGAEYMQALGLQHETSEEELEKLGEKAEEAEKMRVALEARRNKITQAARKFTGKKTELSSEIEVKEPPAEYAYGATPGKYDYKALAKKLRGSDPADMMDTLMSKGWSQAPSEHLESIKKAVDRMQFLKERLPKETPATALRPAAKASEAEWARWKRYYDVVVNPDAFFDQVSSGLVSKEAMEAMETLYPAQLQEFRMSLMAEAERGKALSGAKRAILWQVVGPAAHNMDGNQVQSLQLMQQATAQGAQQQTRPPDGRQSVDAEKNMATQGQRMEAR